MPASSNNNEYEYIYCSCDTNRINFIHVSISFVEEKYFSVLQIYEPLFIRILSLDQTSPLDSFSSGKSDDLAEDLSSNDNETDTTYYFSQLQ